MHIESYIAVAIIAFLLGAAVTGFCYKLRTWRAYKDKEKDLQ